MILPICRIQQKATNKLIYKTGIELQMQKILGVRDGKDNLED